MARLNIEDSIMEKAGFQKLMIKMGDRHKAMGVVWDLWRLAQKYWFPNKELIPLKVFEEAEIPDCIFDKSISLAEKRPHGVYAKGTEEQFAWLFDLREKAKIGGRNSAKIRKEKYGTAQPVILPEAESKHPSNQPEAESKSIEPSLLLTPFSSLSSQSSTLKTHNSTTIAGDEKKEPPASGKSLGSQAFEEYAKAYLVKYGADLNETRDKTINAKFKILGEKLGKDAPFVAGFYLSHNDYGYVKSKHSVSSLIQDAHKLWTEWKTGKKSTSHSARKSELEDHNDQVIEEYRKSKSSEGVPV